MHLKDLERAGEDPTVLMDPRTPWSPTVARQLFALSKKCTQFDPSKRPKMKEVLTVL